MIGTDAPLTPSPDQADTLLGRELLRPEYHDENPLKQLMRWLGRQFDSGLDRAASASPLGTFGAILVFAVVLLLIGWLVSRTRHTATARRQRTAVLTTEPVTAAELRARAVAALARGDAPAAVLEGFRALTLHQIEGGHLEEQPGATAHEVATLLGARHPERRPQIQHAADLFDCVLYGDRPASAEQAEMVLALDDDLAAVR